MEPAGLATILKMLPFQYLAYFPAAVFLDKIPAQQILPLIGVQILWIVFFALAARILWRLGLKHYSAFGG